MMLVRLSSGRDGSAATGAIHRLNALLAKGMTLMDVRGPWRKIKILVQVDDPGFRHPREDVVVFFPRHRGRE